MSILIFKRRNKSMYYRNVTITYNGVSFTVQVPCTPNTEVKVLMERAKKILEDTFDRNGITMMLRA
jgi:hypothetical protein